MPIRIMEADLNLSDHQEAVLTMVDAYSSDAMGNGKPLDPVRIQAMRWETVNRLIPMSGRD